MTAWLKDPILAQYEVLLDELVQALDEVIANPDPVKQDAVVRRIREVTRDMQAELARRPDASQPTYGLLQ